MCCYTKAFVQTEMDNKDERIQMKIIGPLTYIIHVGNLNHKCMKVM
jgi:hypothetical protein